MYALAIIHLAIWKTEARESLLYQTDFWRNIYCVNYIYSQASANMISYNMISHNMMFQFGSKKFL